MAFNSRLTTLENIKHGLWVNGQTLSDMAEHIGTTEDTIKTIVYENFARNGRTPPRHAEVLEYLREHCYGFEAWAKTNGVKEQKKDTQ